MQLVGKMLLEKSAFCEEKDWLFLHGGVIVHAKGLLCLLLHACVELKKGRMARGTPNRGRLEIRDLVA